MEGRPSSVPARPTHFSAYWEMVREPALIVMAVVTIQAVFYFVSWDKFFSGDGLYYLSRQTHTWAEVKTNFLRADDVSEYRPLTYPVFTFLLYPLGDLNPLPYHMMGLLVHVLFSLAVFALLHLILQDYKAALAGYLFFALHSAGYFISYGVAFLPDWMFAAFFLPLLACYWKFLLTRHWRYYLAALLLLVFALLSKETPVMTPFVLFGLVMLRASQLDKDARTTKELLARHSAKAIRCIAPFLSICVFYLLLLVLVKGRLYPESPTHPFHLTLQPGHLVKKLKYLFWAFNIDLRWPLGWADTPYLLICFLQLALAAYVVSHLFRRRESRRPAVWLLFCGIALLFPVFFLVEPPYAHHLYMPLIALGAAVGLFFSRIPDMGSPKRWRLGLFFGVNLIAACLTIHRFDEKSWIAHGSRVARNFLVSLKRHHPTLAPNSVIHLRKSKESNSMWYFDRHGLVRLFYHDPTLSMRYEDLGEKLPPSSGPPIPNYFIYGLWEGNLELLPDYWKGQNIELFDWVLQGEVTEDRSQYYPRYDQFLTPTGRRVFSHYLVLDGERRNTVITLAGTRLRVPLPFVEPGSRLHVGLASALDSGDGFEGILSVERDGKRSILVDRFLNSARDSKDRTWWDYHLDMNPFVGSNNFLILECNAGPANNTQADWLAWSMFKINKALTD
jgi:hypothetical protein